MTSRKCDSARTCVWGGGVGEGSRAGARFRPCPPVPSVSCHRSGGGGSGWGMSVVFLAAELKWGASMGVFVCKVEDPSGEGHTLLERAAFHWGPIYHSAQRWLMEMVVAAFWRGDDREPLAKGSYSTRTVPGHDCTDNVVSCFTKTQYGFVSCNCACGKNVSYRSMILSVRLL